MNEEKYPFIPSGLSPEQKLDVCQKSLWRLIARIVRAVDEKYGEEGLSAIHDSIKNWDVWREPLIRSGLQPGEVSLRDMVLKVWGPGDDIYFTMKEVPVIREDPDESKLLYTVRECNVARQIAKESSKTCRVVARAIEEGVAQAANPGIHITGDRFIATGADGCYIWAEMKQP